MFLMGAAENKYNMSIRSDEQKQSAKAGCFLFGRGEAPVRRILSDCGSLLRELSRSD